MKGEEEKRRWMEKREKRTHNGAEARAGSHSKERQS